MSDWYDPDYYTTSPPQSPKGPESGKYRVLRGGSWDLAPENLRSTRRDFNIPLAPDYDSPSYRNFNSGFRCAKNPVLTPSGAMASSGELMPLSPVPAEYAGEAMGYILGMGFAFKAKPEAFASSSCANKVVN